MRLKITLSLLVISVLATAGAFAVNHKLNTNHNLNAVNIKLINPKASNRSSSLVAVAQQSDEKKAEPRIPESHLYLHLFKHIQSLSKRTKEAQARGEKLHLINWYKTEAVLTDSQTRTLETIASECLAEVEKLDAQASEIIRQVREKYPAGELKDNALPPVPPELIALQNERDSVVLSYRKKLHAAFGDEEFERFTRFIGEKIAPSITMMLPDQAEHLKRLQSVHGEGKRQPQLIDGKARITELPETAENQ